MESAAGMIDGKERRLLLQAGLQQAVIDLQGRVIAGAHPFPVLNDFLKTLVDLSGSQAGFILEGPAGQPAGWRSVVTVNFGPLNLADPDGLLDAGLNPSGTLSVCAATQGRPDHPAFALVRQLRPDLHCLLALKLSCGAALLCLVDRDDGYDAEVIDLLRSIADVAARFLAASRRAFGMQPDGMGANPAGTNPVDAGPQLAVPHLADAQLAAVLGEMAGVVWSASLPDFDLRYISPSVERLLGYRAEAFMTQPDFFDRISPPEDQVLRLAAIHRAQEGQPFDVEHRLICADGSLRWVSCKANVIKDRNGKPVRLDGIISDITADRLALEHGRRSDALYRAVVEDQQEAIVRFKPDHVITFANRQYADLYNLAPEDLLGVKFSDLVAADELAEVLKHLGALSVAEPSCLQESKKLLPGGDRRWIRWFNRALFDSHGAVTEYQCVGHDISDLKRLERELEDGRELLSLAVVSSGDGIFEWHVDTNQVWLSPRWKEMFGYADDELPNSIATWEELADPTDRVRILTEIDAYLHNPVGVLRTTGRYRHRNGGIVHVESRIISRQSTVDGGVRLVGAMSDVTAKVLADQQMGDAIESLSDGFAWFDADDRMIMHNRRFLEFFPFMADMGDLTGLPFIEMVQHPLGEVSRVADPRNYVTDRMKRHHEGGSFELPLDNGGWVRVSERRTKQGGIVSIWSDITELKRAQQRLLDAVAAMQEGFLLVGPDDKIILTNQRCQEMYEIAGHLLEPGRSYREFLHYGAENGQFIEAVGRSEDYVHEVMAMLHSDQNLRVERELSDGRWLLISQRQMSDGSVVGIRTDLTSQKRREAELESAQHQLEKQATILVELAEKLEEARLSAVEASRAKTRFLAHMSHELRTPLNAVLGFARVMDDELFGPIGVPKYKEYVGLIHESGAHLLSLINDVLDLSKIEAGRMELDRRLISVTDLASSSTRLMEGLAKDRQIKLLVQAMPGCEAIYGDERSLKQIVINLLSNALKFTHPGGRVTLSFAQRDDGGSALTVIDTGIGMTPDDIIKALDPFGQVDGEIARQHHGTGLGLPLVKAMAEAHGGSLAIDSEPGIGTTMTVYLPGEGGVPTSAASEAPAPAEANAALMAMPDDMQAAGSPIGRLLAVSGDEGTFAFPSLADSLAPPDAAAAGTILLETVTAETIAVTAVATDSVAAGFPTVAAIASDLKPLNPAPMDLMPIDSIADVAPAASTPATAEAPVATSGLPRLLLAEDNAINRRLVVDILREMPIEVDCAADGEEAVRLVGTATYFLVLMDIQMPRMGGVEATERIRGSGLGKADLPIVALTAHAGESDQARFMAAGMDGYLAKPFDVAALMKLVQRYLIAGRDKSLTSAQAAS